MMITQPKEQYISPESEMLEMHLEGVMALSGEGFENPDIENTNL